MKFEDYPLHVDPIPEEEGGGYLVTIPDLPDVSRTPRPSTPPLRKPATPSRHGRRPNGKTRVICRPRRPGADSSSSAFPKTLHMQLAKQAASEGVSLNQLAATFLAQGLAVRQGPGAG